MKTFSINAASELLERDRRTVIRAMRHVEPDAHEGKSPRWRLRSFLDALERSSERHDDARGQRTDLDDLYDEFDRACDEMKAERSLEKRREMALEIAPQIARLVRLQRQAGAAPDEPALLTELRADKIFMLSLRRFESLCQWSQAETWMHLIAPE